jgi:hypothetical protein
LIVKTNNQLGISIGSDLLPKVLGIAFEPYADPEGDFDTDTSKQIKVGTGTLCRARANVPVLPNPESFQKKF